MSQCRPYQVRPRRITELSSGVVTLYEGSSGNVGISTEKLEDASSGGENDFDISSSDVGARTENAG